VAVLDASFFAIAGGLVGAIVLAARAPTRPVRDARRHAERLSIAAASVLLAALALAFADQPEAGMFASGIGAMAAALGLWLGRCAGGEDDGGEHREPAEPHGGFDWDSFDRERAGWERPLAGAGR
jgi:hypothetical protein